MRARDAARRCERCAATTRRSTRIYTSLFRELLTYMMEDPRNITACTHLLFCAKNIERIGDHATNIAETAIISSPASSCGRAAEADETTRRSLAE